MIYPDLIWRCKYFSSAGKRPNWSGYMQNTSQGYFQGASTVTFLPLIDLKPTDESCIYSLLCFVEGQAKTLNFITPCIHSIIHAWGGCDSTSAIFGNGKTSILLKLQSSAEIQSLSCVFEDYSSSQLQISQAGIRIFVIIYGGSENETLNRLRYVSYMNMLTKSFAAIQQRSYLRLKVQPCITVSGFIFKY